MTASRFLSGATGESADLGEDASLTSLRAKVTAKAYEADLGEDASLTSLRAKVTAKAYETVRNFFHKESSTYIYFNPFVGGLGVKGIGTFPNEAYKGFTEHLAALVSAFDQEELDICLAGLESEQSQLEAQRELAALRSRVSGEISLQVPEEMKHRIDESASDRGHTTADYCRSLLEDQIEIIEHETDFGSMEYIRSELGRQLSDLEPYELSHKGSRGQIRVRIGPELHARLMHAAQLYQIKFSDFCRNLLARDETSVIRALQVYENC